MSRYKNNSGNRPVETCGPNKKSLKEELKYLNIAINELIDLMDNGYINYQCTDEVYGDLMNRKRHLENNLQKLKGK